MSAPLPRQRAAVILSLLVMKQLAFAAVAWFLVRPVIGLGDTVRYLSIEAPRVGFPAALINDTYLIEWLGAALGGLIGPAFYANLPVALVTGVLLYWALRETGVLRHRRVGWLFVLLMCWPSASLWTAVVGKEAIFLLLLLAGSVALLRLTQGGTAWVPIWIAAVVALLLYKALFALLLIVPLAYLWVLRSDAASALFMAAASLAVLLMGMMLLLAFGNQVADLAGELASHFAGGGSTRQPVPWQRPGDVVLQAPWGVLTAFLGPSVSDALRDPVQALTWLEGVVFLSGLALATAFATTSHGSRSGAAFIFMATLWIAVLVVQYPYGIFNAGSAVRYRSPLVFYLIFWIAALYASGALRYRFGGSLGSAS